MGHLVKPKVSFITTEICKYPMLIRNKCKYVMNRSLTEQYRRSAIPDMQRKLNQSLIDQRKLMNKIVPSEL